jgi:hypothetical protein
MGSGTSTSSKMPKPPSLDELMKSLERSIFEYVNSALSRIKGSTDLHLLEVVTNFLQQSISNILDNILKSSPERIFFYIIDVMFAPNLILRQVVLILSLQLMMIASVGISNAAVSHTSNNHPDTVLSDAHYLHFYICRRSSSQASHRKEGR